MSSTEDTENWPYNREFTEAERAALENGEDVLTCPQCGAHFVLVDEKWYHVRGLRVHGSLNIDYWCTECSEELREEEAEDG